MKQIDTKRDHIGDSRYDLFLVNTTCRQVQNRAWESFPLAPLKQIPRAHLVRHVRELVTPAVGDDHVAAGLEGLQVVGHLGAEELRRVQRGLVGRHGTPLAFTRFMTLWMELARKLSELDFIVRRLTSAISFGLSACLR